MRRVPGLVGPCRRPTSPRRPPTRGDISPANFNWTPTTPAAGAFPLGTRTTNGLDIAQALASATTGRGRGPFSLGANLSLAIPATAPAGPYSSTLTLTANPAANFP